MCRKNLGGVTKKREERHCVSKTVGSVGGGRGEGHRGSKEGEKSVVGVGAAHTRVDDVRYSLRVERRWIAGLRTREASPSLTDSPINLPRFMEPGGHCVPPRKLNTDEV